MHIETDGRIIKIESFEYGLTYLGLEDDFSGKDLNELVLDWIAPPTSWGIHPIVRIPLEDNILNGQLPKYYYHAYLTSSPLKADFQSSGLILQWFEPLSHIIIPKKKVQSKLKNLVWEMCAEDFNRFFPSI
jgi:hypothetical protein